MAQYSTVQYSTVQYSIAHRSMASMAVALSRLTFMVACISNRNVRSSVRTDTGVEHGEGPFVRMHVSRNHQIDVILVQDLFNVILRGCEGRKGKYERRG